MAWGGEGSGLLGLSALIEEGEKKTAMVFDTIQKWLAGSRKQKKVP